jgi:hypothetical protein
MWHWHIIKLRRWRRSGGWFKLNLGSGRNFCFGSETSCKLQASREILERNDFATIKTLRPLLNAAVAVFKCELYVCN